jgi:hypothetical protein
MRVRTARASRGYRLSGSEDTVGKPGMLLAPLPPNPDFKPTARASVTSIVFLFQVFMTLALTNGAIYFFTANTNQLEPLAQHPPLQWLLFLVFVFTLVKFAHGITIYLQTQYDVEAFPKLDSRQQFTYVRPLVDFSLPFLQALILYVVSGTIVADTSAARSGEFFVFIGCFFLVDIAWCLVIGALTRGAALRAPLYLGHFALLNGAALGLGALVTALAALAGAGLAPLPAPLPFALVAILFLRAVQDFRWSYHYLYPWPAAAHRTLDA